METRIYLNKGYRNLKPNDIVKTTRAVESFCVHNSLRSCLVKQQGGWYKICLDGILTFVTPALDCITFKELYERLKD
jgi:hypothetical protein